MTKQPTFRCADCKSVSDCKQAFGRFWGGKSLGGVGCNHPFSYQTTIKARPRPYIPVHVTRKPVVKAWQGGETLLDMRFK